MFWSNQQSICQIPKTLPNLCTLRQCLIQVKQLQASVKLGTLEYSQTLQMFEF